MQHVEVPVVTRVARVAGSALVLALAGCGGGDEVARLEAYSERIAELQGRIEELEGVVDEKKAAVSEAEEELADARNAVREAEDALAQVEKKASETATDPVLFRLVQQRLLEDDELENVAISASVTGGVVTLAGEVPSEPLRERAEEVAGSVPGVASVVNRIRVLTPVATQGPAAAP